MIYCKEPVTALHYYYGIAFRPKVLIIYDLMIIAICSVGKLLYVKEHYSLFEVTIRHDGTCIWEPAQQYHSRCPVDVRMYPFDTQTCKLVFGTWSYSEDLLNLTLNDYAESTLLEAIETNVEWDVVGTKVYRESETYDCCLEVYSLVVYELTMRRKPLFYIVHIMIPAGLLAVLVLLVFIVPPESGEKMSMALTLLLSYSVLILIVSDNVPPSSQGVPFIGKLSHSIVSRVY